MGAANCCTCTDNKKYRFKNFVVSVYPSDKHGGPDEEALGKLNSYVASNPERIPRVCRKISKLLVVQLRRKKVDRVMVSVGMLHSLVDKAQVVDSFVPHCIDIAALLLSTNEPRYHVGAADLLHILCSRLHGTASSQDMSRRLIADNKGRLLPQLIKMSTDRIASRSDAVAVQIRYAAIVALGSIATTIHSAMASNVQEILYSMVVNLILVLRERSQKPLSDANVRLLAQWHGSGQGGGGGGVLSTRLPEKSEEQGLYYALACSYGIGAVAGCITSAGVDAFLQRVTSLLDKQEGWSIPFVPSLIFRNMMSAMQARPQQLGFSVYGCLCDAGQRNTDPRVRVGILRALQSCMDELPMTGGRPAAVTSYLINAVYSPAVDAAASDPMRGDTCDAIATLAHRLLRSTYRQANTPQLQMILMSLWTLMESAQSTQQPSPSLALRLMVVAAPYIRAIPLVDRRDMRIMSALEPYLLGKDEELRHLASCVLRELLAGMPDDGGRGRLPEPNCVAAALALFTDEQDVAYAEEWVQAVLQADDGVTPCCIADVSNVLCAMMAGYGASGLPFLLNYLWTLQQQYAKEESVSNRDYTTMNADAVPVMQSKSATSQLTRAWLQMILATLINCGRMLGVQKLVDYSQSLLQRREAAGELCSAFEVQLREVSQPFEAYCLSGLRYVSSQRAVVLSTQFTEAPVSKLPSFRYVASILADAERDDLQLVFRSPSQDAVFAAVVADCFQTPSDPKLRLKYVLDERNASVCSRSQSALGAPEAAASLSLSLAAGDEAKITTLRALNIAVANPDAASGQAGAVPQLSDEASVAGRIAALLLKYKVSSTTSPLPQDGAVTLEEMPLPLLSSSDGADDHTESSEASAGVVAPLQYTSISRELSLRLGGAGDDWARFGDAVGGGLTGAVVTDLPATRYLMLQ